MFDGRWLSPLRRGLFDPLFYLKSGSRLPRHWKELEETQFLSEKVLKERQWQRLESILRYVWENNAFYRARFEKAGITPATVRTPDDLHLIPILTKEEIRRNTPHIFSCGFEKTDLINFKTGGSTGKSLEIYLTEECSNLRNACTRRHDRWTGWEVGEPIAAVWGNPHLPFSIKDKLINNFIMPFIYLDTMAVTEESVLNFVSECNRVKPTLLFGHAHSIYLLAQQVRDLKISSVKPRGILSTSMMLLPHERKVIENVFNVKVTDRYGCEEVSLIASECEKHAGMHLNIEHLFIEFVKENGCHAASGEPGRIIVTDLFNRAMPFIRYQVEDIGVPSDRKCTCGRGLPLLEHVTGRVADFLVRKDGARIAGVSLIENTLTKISGIDQMQIIQESLDLITLNLVVDSSFNQTSEHQLLAYFKDLFHYHADIRINYKEVLPSEDNGKYRFSICKIA